MRKMMLAQTVLLLAAVSGPVSCTSAPELTLLSRSLLQAPARDVAFFEGGTAAAAGGALYIIPDGSAPGEGHLLPLEGEPMSLAVSGAIVLAAVRGQGLVAVDLSDPYRPSTTLVREIGDVRSCAAGDGCLLVGSDGPELLLFDISSPEAPLLKDTMAGPAPGTVLAGSGDLFAAAGGGAVVLLRAAAGGLEEVSRVDAPEKAEALLLGGGVLHMLTSEGEVRRWSLADRSSPRPLAALPERDISGICGGPSGGLALLGDGRIVPFPYAAGGAEGSGAGDPPDPSYSMMRGEGMPRSPSFPGSSIRSSAGRLATFGPEEGFHLYSIRGGYAEADGDVPAGGFAIDLVARDGYVFLANGRDGLRIGRVSEDGAIEWTGHVQTADARDVALEGDLLLLADGGGGLKIFRLREGAAPKLVSTYESQYFLSAVMTHSGKAYVAAGLYGAIAVDFTDPGKPFLAWSEDLSEVRGLDLDGRYLYIADGFEGYRIYDLAAGAPQLLSTMNTPGWVSDLFVSGDLLYIADGQKGLMTADVSDRASPASLGRVETGAIAREIHARGATVFVATQKGGLTAVDVSDPRHPVVAQRYRTVDDARGTFADERFVYLASGAGGLYIFGYSE